ncbi:MAG TPA: DNA internalization-related competence protein ComEC/Rec2 [Candidatus Binatia bacterium]|nr:DNA internalization-related competence protein ComEC/Rec2 [Candidatus Binatia bacterium]
MSWVVLAASVLVAQQLVIGAAATALTMLTSLAVVAVTVAALRARAVSSAVVAAGAAAVCAAAWMAHPSVPAMLPGTAAHLLEKSLGDDVKVRLEGRASAVVPTYGGGVRMTLALERAAPDGEMLSDAAGLVSVTVRSTRSVWRTGDRIALTSRLRRITGFGNFGEFDWAAYNARRGIVATAYAWEESDVERLPRRDGRIDAIRRAFSEACARRGGQGAELLEALIIGDRFGIDRRVSDAVRDAGLAHYLAISGSHMALIVVVVVAMVRRIAVATPAVRAGYDVMRMAAVAAMAALAGYAAISGGGVSVTRSVLMAAATLLAMWRGRPDDAVRALGASAVVLAFQLPGVGEEAGFQLSFAAVAALIAHARGWQRPLSGAAAVPAGRLRRGLRVLRKAGVITLVCWAVTAPLVAQCFHRVSLVAPLANLVAAPIVSAVVVIGLVAVMALPLGGAITAAAVDVGSRLAEALIVIASTASVLPMAAVATPEPGPLLTGALTALPVAMLTPWPWRRQAVASLTVVAAVCLMAGLHARFRSDRTDVWFASVGQGDGAVVRMAGGRVLVIDGGPPGRGHLVMGPMLRRLWIGRIDVLMASHVQADHSGAFLELLEDFRVGELWIPAGDCDSTAALALKSAAEARGVPVRQMAAGGQGGPGLAILGPRSSGRCDSNDQSVIVAVEHAGRRVLFTGDIESGAEALVVAQVSPRALRADVLKVPHHGSRTSSTEAFLDAVDPELAVALLGLGNRYGFPAPEVEARYQERGIRWLRADRCGAVHLSIGDDGIRVRTALAAPSY